LVHFVTMAQPKEKDPISLEIHTEMLRSTGASISRLKKRLKETNMAFQLKPPEDEKMEVKLWEQKIDKMIAYKEKHDFPTVMEIKRTRAKREQGLAESNAEKDRIDADRKAMHATLAKEANRKLNLLRQNKRFGKANTFGGPIEGEAVKYIDNYKGMNSIYDGERTLIRKDGRFTRQVGTSEIPPWIGPQYYSNLDPKFLAEGIFPESISEIPFKSLTSSRDQVGRSAKELRDSKIIRREKLDSWRFKDPGPRYTKTPERLSPERLLRHHGYIKDENDNFIKDHDTVASSHCEPIDNPWATTDRRVQHIILGDLTRQEVLVAQEDKMNSRLPPSKQEEIRRRGPSQTKLKAESMLANATSYISTSNTLSAKMARHDIAVKEALDGGVVNGRIDYTRGALNDINNLGAKAEHTHPAPSVSGSDQGSVVTSLLSSKQMMEENFAEVALGVTDVAYASPVKKLLMVGKAKIDGENSNMGEKMSAEEQAKEEAKAENARLAKIEEEKRKIYLEKRSKIREEYNSLSPIKKTFSKRKLPLISPIKPLINKWVTNKDTVYHREKEPDWLPAALERQREEMLAALPEGMTIKSRNALSSKYENVEDLFLSAQHQSEIQKREKLNEFEINELYDNFLKESETRRKLETEGKAKAMRKRLDDESGIGSIDMDEALNDNFSLTSND